MGIVSVVFYAGRVWVSQRALGDLITSMGLLIAFYYGLTGFAAAWEFRGQLRAGTRAALQIVILPLLGGVALLVSFVLTAADSYAADFGETALLGIGGVFVLGIGSILLGIVLMVGYNLVAPEYFLGTTMLAGTVVTEEGTFVPAGPTAP
jgi:hypothetical protein